MIRRRIRNKHSQPLQKRFIIRNPHYQSGHGLSTHKDYIKRHTLDSPIAILQQRIQQGQRPGLPMNVAILEFLSKRPGGFGGPDNHQHVPD